MVCEYAWRAIAVPGRAAAEGLSETAGSSALAHTHELAHDMDLRTHAFAHASLRRERKRAPEFTL